MPKTKPEELSGSALAQNATPITQAERQRSYHQKQRKRGLVRLSVYIPDSERDTFWDAVDRLRITWQRKGLID